MERINKTGWYGVAIRGCTLSYTWLGYIKYEAEMYADALGFMSMEHYEEGDIVSSYIHTSHA